MRHRRLKRITQKGISGGIPFFHLRLAFPLLKLRVGIIHTETQNKNGIPVSHSNYKLLRRRRWAEEDVCAVRETQYESVGGDTRSRCSARTNNGTTQTVTAALSDTNSDEDHENTDQDSRRRGLQWISHGNVFQTFMLVFTMYIVKDSQCSH